MDPVELRMRNLVGEGEVLSVGTPLPKGVSIKKVVEEGAKAGGWLKTKEGWKRPGGYSSMVEGKPGIRKGIGFACAFKNVGFSYGAPEKCWAIIELIGENEIEHAILYHAGADVGQGSHTVFVQMAAEALGLPV